MKVGETKVLEVVVDEVCRVSVFSDVDGVPAGSTELVAAGVEVSSGPEGCNVPIEIVKVFGARADEYVAAAFDRVLHSVVVLDSVVVLALKDEVALLVKLVAMLLLAMLLQAGTVLFRRAFVHCLPRNVVIEDMWMASRDAWGDHGETFWSGKMKGRARGSR